MWEYVATFYNGLTTHKEAEPRLGIAYNIKPSNTVLRVSYARVLETPFNENLVLSNQGCGNPVLNPLLLCSSPSITPLTPGWRNEFHAGFSRLLGNMRLLRASKSGSTRTMRMISAFSVPLRLLFQLSGIARKFRDLQAA
jgi:hypothetical protein